MKRAQHTEHCRRILGDGYPEVHDWLDELADKLGPKHRDIRHNPKGVAFCIDRWGYKAGAAACLHIWADRIGLIQTDDGRFEIVPIIEPGKVIRPKNWDEAMAGKPWIEDIVKKNPDTPV